MSSEENPCYSNKNFDDAEMDVIAKAHIERENCFVTKLMKRFANESCIPRFLQNYPDFVNNISNWCNDKLNGHLLDPISEILVNECPAPCTSISYEKTMEPFHGAANVIPWFCEEPANIFNFFVVANVNMIEVGDHSLRQNLPFPFCWCRIQNIVMYFPKQAEDDLGISQHSCI